MTETYYSIPNFGPACTKLVSKTQAATSGLTTTTLIVSAHAAWQIEWMAKDAPTLTPQPPSMDLCYDVQIPTWTPGSEATGRKKCRSLQDSPDKHQYDGLVYIAIVLPTVIGFLLITGCICCCVCYRRKKNRQRREAERPAELPGDEASSLELYKYTT